MSARVVAVLALGGLLCVGCKGTGPALAPIAPDARPPGDQHLAAWGLAVSPDHKRLAFVLKPPVADLSQVSPYLGVCDLASGDVQWINTHMGLNAALSWSPGGDQLAFCGAPLDSRGNMARDRRSTMQLAVCDLRSGATRVISHPRGLSLDFTPAWSPKGGRIAFVRIDGTRTKTADVWTVGPDGQPEQRVTSSGRCSYIGVGWAADGSRVYYAQDGDVWSAPVLGSSTAARQVTQGLQARFVAQGSDPRYLLCHCGAGDAPWSIRVLLTADPTQVLATVPSGGDPAMSPDGRHVAFLEGGEPSGPNGPPAYRFCKAPVGDAGKVTQLADGVLSLALGGWLPDGEIVFTRTGRICAIRSDGACEREILRLPEHLGQ